MSKQSRRSFVFWSMHLPNPDCDAVTKAPRCSLKPAIGPLGIAYCVVETGLAVKTVEIGANDLTVFHPNSGIINEVGNTARRVDLIMRAAHGAGFRLQDFNAFGQPFFQNEDTS
jgi:hypothetical protein